MTRMLATAAMILALPALAQAAPMEAREGWEVIETDQTFEELNQSLETAIEQAGMGLVTSASASAGAKAQDITIPGNRVVGVFRNDYARRMLDASIAAGIEAPIRFYLVEDEDGTATLAFKRPTLVFEPYYAEGADDLRQLAVELDDVFMTIAAEAAAAR
ncbi:DUF302 domain-containing protein [Geminicoccus roseus]|uniref:DUF302 domain-containing protein n=1 Tax=Geminicoccus roseus TaxID=404900 RepID=UPI00041B6504|nr:DUF302 domain-containing protein [Geminicoccus roseus]